MAGIDYYLCDICGRKTFYDADLSYDQKRCNPATSHEWPDNVGFMFVLCVACANDKTTEFHKVARELSEAIQTLGDSSDSKGID